MHLWSFTKSVSEWTAGVVVAAVVAVYGLPGARPTLTGFYPDLKKSVTKIAIGSFHMKSTRVIPHEIDFFPDNHSISHTEVS